MKVETTTASGQPILCTVVERIDDGWFLDSPAHGYQIFRRARDLKLPTRILTKQSE